VLRDREILEAEGSYVVPTSDERDEARAHLAAEDAEVAAKAAAAKKAHDHDHDGHDHELADELEDDELEEEEA
jgi:hypothetical protein